LSGLGATAARVIRRAHPLSSLEFGSVHEEAVRVEGLVFLEHEVGGAAELGGQDREGLALAVLATQSVDERVGRRIPLEEADGGLAEGPLEMGVADLGATGARALAGARVLALDETGVGGELLNAGKAPDGVDLVEDREAEDLADAGDRLKEPERVGVVASSLADEGSLETFDERLVMLAEEEIGFDGGLDRDVVEGLREPVAPGGGFETLALGLGDVVLVEGVLDVGEELGPLAPEEETAPEQVPGGAHAGRIDVGHGDRSAPEEGGQLLGVEAVVLRLAAVDRLEVEGVGEDEGDVELAAEVGQPVPAEDALGADDEIVAVGPGGLEEGLALAGDSFVQDDRAAAFENAQVHGPGMEVDATVEPVLLPIESQGTPPGRGCTRWGSRILPAAGQQRQEGPG